MKAVAKGFDEIVETIYNLPLEDREELKNLLEHNIADARRAEIFNNFQESKTEYKKGEFQFSSDLDTLKKML